MSTPARPDPLASAARRAWVPRQHGAWAMLILPILVGIAASRLDPWQLALAGAAISGYLASASFQTWNRARRSQVYRQPVLVYGAVFLALGTVLAVAFPALLLVLIVAGPATLLVLGGARPGSGRDLAGSLAQVAQALVLVPAAAWISGAFEPDRVVPATLVTAAYLVGTVLTVRSLIRERANPAFAAASVAFHVAITVAAAILLPFPYAIVGAGLAVRATMLPVLQRRLAGTPRALRPVHLGVVEVVASCLVVLTTFLAPL